MFSAPVNLVAIVVAAVVYMVVGMFWYSPMGFGKPWMKLVGMKEGEMKGSKMTKPILLSFITALIMSYVLAHFIFFAGEKTALGGAKIAFWGWLGFVATMVANDFIYAVKEKPWSLYLINVGYVLVSLVIMGAILGAWM